ncbi:MAG: DinB family protein [Vicinamibacterales bacterium]
MFDFLVETYDTERLKTLSVWSQVGDADMAFRPEVRARTPREHMVHQCVSEDVWFIRMLGVDVAWPPLPAEEARLAFMGHYAEASRRRLDVLRSAPTSWFTEETSFFDVRRSRAWVIVRRIAHSAHHRGQLTAYLRLLGHSLYSTYGPTADTGGLFANQAPVVYRYPDVETLIEREAAGGVWPAMSGPGSHAVTERPG